MYILRPDAHPAGDNGTAAAYLGTMRAPLTVTIATILALAAGCSSATPAANSTPDQSDFLKVVRVVLPGSTDSAYIHLGRSICDKLDAGMTPSALASGMVGTGAVNQAGATVLLRASVAVYCPQHSDEVPPQS